MFGGRLGSVGGAFGERLEGEPLIFTLRLGDPLIHRVRSILHVQASFVEGFATSQEF